MPIWGLRMIRAALALGFALGFAQPALAVNPQLRSDVVEGVQPLLAMGANLCVGAMRMGNALPLRVLDDLGEDAALGMENRLYSDRDRLVDVILAGTSPGQRELPAVFCLTQPRQPMAEADKAALRDWAVAEFARLAEIDGVTPVALPEAQFFGRMVSWCGLCWPPRKPATMLNCALAWPATCPMAARRIARRPANDLEPGAKG